MKRWFPVSIALVMFVGLSFAAPTIINNILRPHSTDESNFPTPASTDKGGLMYGTDAGRLYVNSGTVWEPVTLDAGYLGTVTSFSVTTANGVSASVATATTTPAATFTLGAITPSSVVSTGQVASGGGSPLTSDGGMTISLGVADFGRGGIRTDGGINVRDPTSAGGFSVVSDTNGQAQFSAGLLAAGSIASTYSGVAAFYANSSATYAFLADNGKIYTAVASGSDAFTMKNGARLNFSVEGDTSSYLYRSASNTLATPALFSFTSTGYPTTGVVQFPELGTFHWAAGAGTAHNLFVYADVLNFDGSIRSTSGYSGDSGGAASFPVGLSAASTITSTIASGSKAFAASVNGARWDFGAGTSDYCSSDGTTVTFAGPLGSSVASGSNFLSALDGARLNFSTGDASSYIYRSGTNQLKSAGDFYVGADFYAGTGARFSIDHTTGNVTTDGRIVAGTGVGPAGSVLWTDSGSSSNFAHRATNSEYWDGTFYISPTHNIEFLNSVWEYAASPTITGFTGTGASITANGTAVFDINVGTVSPGSGGTITFPSASTTGWACRCYNKTTTTALNTIIVTSDTTTTCVIAQVTTLSNVATNFAASDHIRCMAGGL